MNWTLLFLVVLALAVTALLWRAGVGFLRRWSAVVELVLAVIAIALVTSALIGEGGQNGYLVAGLLAAALWFGRDAVRDYISGVRIRSQRRIALGDALTVGDVEGVVSRIGRLSMSLEDERGSVSVPHSKVAATVVRQRTQRAGARPHRFLVSWDGEMGQVHAARVIERAALLDPLCAVGHGVLLEPVGPREIAVTVHALDGTHAFSIEHSVRRALNQHADGPQRIEQVV